jgi:hypothetical protein
MASYGGFSRIDEYLNYLWFTMHHSDDPNKQVWAFHTRCYLDESGTHDGSPYTVVAGLLLNRSNFVSLGIEWQKMLCERGIKVPIHMTEFGPHGNLGHLSEADRYLLFANIAGIINSHKTYSLAGVLGQEQYKKAKVHKRKEMSPYGYCFLYCVKINHLEADFNKYPYNIAYLMSEVSEHKGQILAAHATTMVMQEIEKQPYHMGSITFDYPKNVPALQAADVIAWGVNRKLMGKPFDQGFEFIETIIDGPSHKQGSYSNEDMEGHERRLRKFRN